ncbi:MAG: AAA family ATPase [Smithella sp.]|nr:AAA family ATPase [Smithella sp.]
MYKKFYGFKARPFEITPDPFYVYLSEAHQEALASLQYAIQEGKGFSVITGEAGTGKTTLVHKLLGNLDGRVRTSYIFNPLMDRDDFLLFVCKDLGIDTSAMKSRGDNIAALHNFLLSCFARHEKVFLIIDEAHCMEPELLQEVRLMTNLETAKHKLLHVILLGQPELTQILNKTEFRPLKQRITVRYHLSPLDLDETKQYVSYRLKRAGSRNITVFTNSAVKEIYRFSGGIPRLINIICDNALLTGFSSEQKRINREIIRKTAKEMDISPPGKSKIKKIILRTALAAAILLLVLLSAFAVQFHLAYWR